MSTAVSRVPTVGERVHWSGSLWRTESTDRIDGMAFVRLVRVHDENALQQADDVVRLDVSLLD